MTVIKTDLLACYVPVLPCALFIIKSMKGYRQVLMRQEIAEDKRNMKTLFVHTTRATGKKNEQILPLLVKVKVAILGNFVIIITQLDL